MYESRSINWYALQYWHIDTLTDRKILHRKYCRKFHYKSKHNIDRTSCDFVNENKSKLYDEWPKILEESNSIPDLEWAYLFPLNLNFRQFLQFVLRHCPCTKAAIPTDNHPKRHGNGDKRNKTIHFIWCNDKWNRLIFRVGFCVMY